MCKQEGQAFEVTAVQKNGFDLNFMACYLDTLDKHLNCRLKRQIEKKQVVLGADIARASTFYALMTKRPTKVNVCESDRRIFGNNQILGKRTLTTTSSKCGLITAAP